MSHPTLLKGGGGIKVSSSRHGAHRPLTRLQVQLSEAQRRKRSHSSPVSQLQKGVKVPSAPACL